MAEFLVIAKCPEDSHSTCSYEVGNVVTIKPDGFSWGEREDKRVWVAKGLPPNEWLGRFCIVSVTGQTHEMPWLLSSYYTETEEGELVLVSKRTWNIDLGSLRAEYREELELNSYVDISLDEFTECCQCPGQREVKKCRT